MIKTTHFGGGQWRPLSGRASVAGLCHASSGGRSAGRPVAAVAVAPVKIVRAVFFAAGQLSDGGHGGTVGLSKRSIVSNSVGEKNKQTNNTLSAERNRQKCKKKNIF